MTQEQREKLVFCTGVLAGLSWLVENDTVADSLNSVQDDIEQVLKGNFESDDSLRCTGCAHEHKKMSEYPCSECMHNFVDKYEKV